MRIRFDMPKVAELEECVRRNNEALDELLNKFFETEGGERIKSSIKDIRTGVIKAKPPGFGKSFIITGMVNSLSGLMMDIPDFGIQLGSLKRQLPDSTESVANNLAYLIYKQSEGL